MRKDRVQTPDKRYFVARGVMRRCTNPNLDDRDRRAFIKTLMQARMAMRSVDTAEELSDIRSRIDVAKIALGEAGPVWWDDDAVDVSGLHPSTTDYASWWEGLADDVRRACEIDVRDDPSPE